MGDTRVVPKWLKSLPLAPEYRPTDTEFADPIAFISRIEQEASAFGICKVIPPLPKPSKRFVLANLTRSLSNSPDVNPASGPKDTAAAPVFTTRQQELGSKKPRGPSVHKQVWQSGEFYTLEQFEAKSKAFAKTQLGSAFKDATPLEVETVFWKAAAEKPIYIEYANDVPGSGFAVPEDMHGYHYHRRRGKRARFRHGRRSLDGSVMNLTGPTTSDATQNVPHPENSNFKKDMEGTAGWKLSNSPWNLQVIARSPGSLTRFMPDEVPGVTSPMVYIAMLFSWFAWHVEDHELHSLNFLHTGAPKTWYAVPGDYATTMEELVHQYGYGDSLDKLAAFMVLGEKRTLLSPEILVASGIPCCRLVQNPGEFVVTFPRSYHVGFSHGFNCGEAANFATSKWLEFAKDAATRRAAMNYLPMLSHQQLLYMLAMSFISRVPRAFLPGARSSRLRDRRKEDRELLVKKAFLQDLTHEKKLLRLLLQKKHSSYAVLWDSDILPSPATHSQSSSQPLAATYIEQPRPLYKDKKEGILSVEGDNKLSNSELVEKSEQDGIYDTRLYTDDCIESAYIDDGDLPCGLDADSGVLACVACGVLGYPFMCIIQPSDKASHQLFAGSNKKTESKVKGSISTKADVLNYSFSPQRKNSANHEITNVLDDLTSGSDAAMVHHDGPSLLDICTSEHRPVTWCVDREDEHLSTIEGDDSGCEKFPPGGFKNLSRSVKDLSEIVERHFNGRPLYIENEIGDGGALNGNCGYLDENWDTSNQYLRPRLFCLRHALEVEELLLCKGGSRILVICNSDYLKIMGQAMSVGEEIGVQLNMDDIPLTNASKSELDLINISIDDDECKEQEEDWTMKLGVNLRHFVKRRKQSSQKQELFALALGELVSDTFCHRISPGLKWKGKRSRTPYRMMADSENKRLFKIGSNINKDNQRSTTTICNHLGEMSEKRVGKRSDMSFNKCLKQPANYQDEEFYQISGCVPFYNTVDMEKGASNYIPCTNFESVNNECLDDDQRFPENKSSWEVSESAIPETTPLPRLSIDGSVAPTGTEVQVEFSMGVVDNEELQNPGGDLVCCQKLLCMGSNLEQKVDDPDVNNGQGTVAACMSDPRHDASIADKAGLATKTVDIVNLLTEGPESTITGNPKLLQPFLVNNPENDSCSVEIIEPCIEVAVSDGPSNDVDLDISGIATESDDPICLGAECSDPTADNGKLLQPILVGSPSKNDTCSDINVEPCMEVAAFHEVSNAVRLKATAGNENSLECTVDSVDAEECQMNANISPQGSRQKYDAMQIMETGKPGNPSAAVNSPGILFVYVRRKKLTEKRDNPIMHSCTEKLAGTSKNTGFKGQESLEGSLDAPTGSNAGCGPTSSDEGYSHSNDGNSTAKKTRKFKRKREVEQLSTSQHSGSSFVRGPCEGLRVRTGRITYEEPKMRNLKITSGHIMKKSKVTVAKRNSHAHMPFVCGLEGCKLRFQTKEALNLHKRNRCTYEGCGKRFRNHRYTMRHQRVHDNNRPFKCPWKGCSKSFNWEWARTEHLRLHTGERPYKCSDPECGLTFRFISDFSRHRRKTGHVADG